MSTIDSKLPVDEVCRQFGSFARLKCEKIEADSSNTSSDDDPVQPNAFQVLLMNQRALSSKSTLPARLEPRNNKDKLFNDLVLLFEKRDWKWHDGGNTHGKKFISNLCDVLWYIDGLMNFILNVVLALTDHWLKRDLKICFFVHCITLLIFSVIVFLCVLNLSVCT